MSALIHRSTPRTTSAVPATTGLPAFFARVIRRLADSPLDHTVLRVAATRAPAPPRNSALAPGRPRAHWHTVTGPDGRRRPEARWRNDACAPSP